MIRAEAVCGRTDLTTVGADELLRDALRSVVAGRGNPEFVLTGKVAGRCVVSSR